MTQDVPKADTAQTPRAALGREVVLVLALSLGASGVSALLSFIGSVTARKPLAQQTAQLVTDYAPGRPWLGLAWQLFAIATALVPVALVAHLMARGGESLRGTLGFSLDQKGRDLARGAMVAAVIGGSGLALYLAARASGLNLTVVPTNLPDVWWRIPVLVGSAVQNAVLEETIVLGYLVHRLGQLGWSTGRTIAASSLLRGSYHLYQGVGGFAGNAVMGVIFCLLYRRWGRVMPLVIAHALIDTVAFVGSVLLAGHVSWLPANG
ncbi:MAG TPA: CPBP family intramembrane glutamic endopeptidase [Streptosporangiaceae bacterium]